MNPTRYDQMYIEINIVMCAVIIFPFIFCYSHYVSHAIRKAVLGSATRSEVQLHRPARIMKVWTDQLLLLYNLSTQHKNVYQNAQIVSKLSCSHISFRTTCGSCHVCRAFDGNEFLGNDRETWKIAVICL